MAQKNALSIQSLACHGKCSLTEAMPIISSCGISLSVLPTVLLSTHTGGFSTPQKLDTTEFLINSVEHYKSQKIKFDGVYTGYFSSAEQIDFVANQIDFIKKGSAMVLVDPVLGDNGKFFGGIDEGFLNNMLKLCKTADVITPNVTEAYLLCKETYKENPTEDELLSLAIKLYNLTKASVVITGVQKSCKIGALVFDGENAEFILKRKKSAYFHGTGDIFASVIFAYLFKGKTLKQAVSKAEKFILKALEKTLVSNFDERNGIEFESVLKDLM